MTTAIDTNVLLDIVFLDSSHYESSLAALAEADAQGALVICEAVYAELAAYFGSVERLETFLDDIGVRLQPSQIPALMAAGNAWREYTQRRQVSVVCPQCGTHQDVKCSNCGRELRPRQHLLADLMIGAHAIHQAEQLLTRDRGFYAAYFPELRLM